MGLKSKVKKATSKATSVAAAAVKPAASVASTAKKIAPTIKTVHETTMKVANNPIVKTAATAVATAYGGPAGAAAVQSAYKVANTADAYYRSVSKKYKETKGYIEQFKGDDSPLNTVLTEEYQTVLPEEYQTVLLEEYKKEKIMESAAVASKSFINGAASVSTKVRKGSLIDSILDRIFDFFGL